MEPFSDFILEHYSEPSHIYEDAIADITDTRQVCSRTRLTARARLTPPPVARRNLRLSNSHPPHVQAAKTPTRDAQGVSLLFRYYNLLYYVERRFFPPDRSLGVYFEWYDSLTGKVWRRNISSTSTWGRRNTSISAFRIALLQACPPASGRWRSRRRAYCSTWPPSTPRSGRGRTARPRRGWTRPSTTCCGRRASSATSSTRSRTRRRWI